MRATRIEGAARKQQIPRNSVAQVAFQTRDASKSGNKPQAQLGKSKARHFVGYDDVASESELESPAKASPVNRRNGDKGSRVYRVHNRVNALKKAANSFWAFSLGNRSCMTIEFAQVSACRKNRFSGAGDNARGSFGAERAEGADEYFQLLKHGRANFIGRFMVERQFDAPFAPFPAERLALEALHACCLLTASRSCLPSYMALISEAKRALTASRRSLPFAVSSPLSGVNALPISLKSLIWR